MLSDAITVRFGLGELAAEASFPRSDRTTRRRGMCWSAWRREHVVRPANERWGAQPGRL